MRLYSKRAEVSEGLDRLGFDAISRHRSGPDPTPLVPQRVERRLGAETLEQIVLEYVTGVSTVVLAERYCIGKGTLLRILNERGIHVRRTSS